ncbi:MAG: lipoyl(octanoyl) transferase LipB [Ignavibacteriae bacterium]|nr:lipoyl(octanoyl) transferase LipB [Ignavibacteriota bacterium]
MEKISFLSLGLTSYKSTWDLQKRLFELRTKNEIDDVLLLTEHHHVFTLGKSSDENHLLAKSEELKANNIDVFEIDRGGDVTYHGPGQLVGYPILDLNNYYNDIHRYLREIEEVIVRTLSEFGISATRDDKYTGVWVGNDKIAAIGVKVSRWVTMHGFALNVNTDVSYFDRIIPCGIFHKGVTSMERLLGTTVPMEEVSSKIVHHVGKVFNVRVENVSRENLFEKIKKEHVLQESI